MYIVIYSLTIMYYFLYLFMFLTMIHFHKDSIKSASIISAAIIASFTGKGVVLVATKNLTPFRKTIQLDFNGT